MKRNRFTIYTLVFVVAGLVVLTIAVSGGGATKLKATAISGGRALAVRHTALGNTLVDAKGRTLYLFRADRPNRSTLSRAGFAVWPAFTSTGTPEARSGVSASHIATIRSAGGRQVTYYGHPLYYFVGDRHSGEANGQGVTEFGALWYVLAPNGTAVTSAPRTPAPVSSETSGGYRY
jgi:predicted lipoprotein with Yx(FWY)xxD motif